MNTHRKTGMFRAVALFFRDAAAHPGKYFNIFSMPARKQIHFLINLIFGLLISILLHAAEHTDLGEKAVNIVSDALTRVETSDAIMQLKTAFGMPVITGRVVYIDIDRETYLQWETPMLVPRDRLAKYIAWAAHYGAGVVVLDIFTDYADCCFPCRDALLRDALLRSVLTSLSVAGSPTKTKIILPVDIDSGGKVRGSIFDDLVDEKTIYRGIPYGSESMDRVTRYWIAYGTGKEGGFYKVLWGIPLLAAMVSDNRYSELKELEVLILKHAPGVSRTFSDKKKIRISFDNEDIYTQRIRFLTLPGRGDSLSYIRSARYLKEPDGDEDMKLANTTFFKGKIVVIGNSSPDQKDIHFTPHGNLAGMFIIGNAVSTIREGLQPSPLPEWAVYLFEGLAIFVASFAFLYLTALRANLIASALMLSVLVPATVYCYFQFGVLINAIFPVLGMSLHQFSSGFEEVILHWMGKEDDESV